MRVLICGSRSVANPKYKSHSEVVSELQFIDRTLSTAYSKYHVIIQGEAPGADSAAKAWAWRNGVPTADFPADWKQYGKRAGFLRNTQMLEEGKPDLVLAFTDQPLALSKGTAMMVRIALDAGLTVHHFRTDLQTQEF